MKWLCYLWQDQNITHEYDSVHYYDVGVFLLSHSQESLKKILVCLKNPIVSFLACVTKAFMSGSAARTLGLTWKNFRGDAKFQFKKLQVWENGSEVKALAKQVWETKFKYPEPQEIPGGM